MWNITNYLPPTNIYLTDSSTSDMSCIVNDVVSKILLFDLSFPCTIFLNISTTHNGTTDDHLAPVVFFNYTNQFNSVSRQEFFNVISGHFPELLPLTMLFYNDPNPRQYTTIGMKAPGDKS
jgi:hypothetical protein